MRTGLWLLTILLVLVGFVFPAAWLGAAVTAALAILGGGIVGVRNVVDHLATQQCPFCRKRVPHTATKCPHCAEWLNGREYVSCSLCKSMNVRGSSVCANCGAQLYLT